MKRRKHRRTRRDVAHSPNLDAYRVRFTPHATSLTWTLTRHGRFASGGEATSEAHAQAQATRAAERHARREAGTRAERDAAPTHALLRVTDGRSTRYYRATNTGKWRGNYGGSIPDINYEVRAETDTTGTWRFAHTQEVPRTVREQLRLSLQGWETPNTLRVETFKPFSHSSTAPPPTPRLTRRDAGLDKKALHKTIDADLKAKAKAKLQALRADLARTVADDKARCKAARAVSITHAKRIQARAARAAAAIRREIARFEARAKTACGTSSTAAKQALDEERRYQASLRRSAQGAKAKAHRPGIKKPRAVVAAESDDEVRGNIDPHLIPLFNRVRRGIVATTRKSRTEAFLEYVEEHPDEVYADMDDATDALIADLERQQRAGRDRTRRRRSRLSR